MASEAKRWKVVGHLPGGGRDVYFVTAASAALAQDVCAKRDNYLRVEAPVEVPIEDAPSSRLQTTIWKYALALSHGPQTIELPENAQPLCVRMQRGVPQLWALVNPGSPKVKRTFHVVATGEPFGAEARYERSLLGRQEILAEILDDGGNKAPTSTTDLSTMNYVGTFFTASEEFVFHVFVAPET